MVKVIDRTLKSNSHQTGLMVKVIDRTLKSKSQQTGLMVKVYSDLDIKVVHNRGTKIFL